MKDEEGEPMTLAEWWDRRWRNYKSKWWVRWFRFDNRRQDIWAVLRGSCNADTWDPSIPGYHAYSHWRCGKRRGHHDGPLGFQGAHRFNNYVWEGPGHRVEYAPLEVGGLKEFQLARKAVIPFAKLAGGRHVSVPRRRARIMAKANQELRQLQDAQRRRSTRSANAARLNGAVEAAFRRARLPEEPLPYPNEEPLEAWEHPQPLRPVEDIGDTHGRL